MTPEDHTIFPRTLSSLVCSSSAYMIYKRCEWITGKSKTEAHFFITALPIKIVNHQPGLDYPYT